MHSKRSPQILVITTTGDAHLPFVEKHLNSPLVVLDPLLLPTGTPLTYKITAGDLSTFYKNQALDNVASIWIRKPEPIDTEKLPLKKEFREYAAGALSQQFRQLYTSLPDALWVSDHYAIARASDKPYQLAIAADLGFRVPDTVFTSDASEAKDFLDKHKTVIMKSLAPFYVLVDGQQKAMYSTRIHTHKPPKLDNLHLSPMIFQQAIEPDYDIRVTVVGHKVFPATIRNTGLDEGSHVRDWRIGHFEGQMHIEPHKHFPKDVADLCVRHVKALGLNFGAIDLVLDKKGKYWFLENNPNGQWGFIERLTELPIGKAMAELLAKSAA